MSNAKPKKANPCNEELLDALREIAGMGERTLLGDCCVSKTCEPTEHSSCAVQEKANIAFDQAASVAKKAIAKAEVKSNG